MPLSPENKRAYDNARNRVKREAIWELKKVPCADCGQEFPPYVMDFDHRGDKSFQIGSMLASKNMEQLLAEVEKCDVVCSNCHRIRTYERGQHLNMVLQA